MENALTFWLEVKILIIRKQNTYKRLKCDYKNTYPITASVDHNKQPTLKKMGFKVELEFQINKSQCCT